MFQDSDCSANLVSGPNPVPNNSITASSFWIDPVRSHAPWNARLNKATDAGSIGAWVASGSDESPYIQVEKKRVFINAA